MKYIFCLQGNTVKINWKTAITINDMEFSCIKCSIMWNFNVKILYKSFEIAPALKYQLLSQYANSRRKQFIYFIEKSPFLVKDLLSLMQIKK